MKRNSKSVKSVKPAQTEEAAIAVIEEAAAEQPAPEPAKKSNLAPKFAVLGAPDEMGFGQQTETSWLIKNIRSGKFTKQSLLDAFLARFVPSGDAGEIKRKKTSFSVFFSDVKRPLGTYHASRSLVIKVDDETGILSLDEKRYGTVVTAINQGILDKLRGMTPKKHATKIESVLKEFHLPHQSAA